MIAFFRPHIDECIINCPTPRGDKCRIGHWCWCSSVRIHIRRGTVVRV